MSILIDINIIKKEIFWTVDYQLPTEEILLLWTLKFQKTKTYILLSSSICDKYSCTDLSLLKNNIVIWN